MQMITPTKVLRKSLNYPKGIHSNGTSSDQFVPVEVTIEYLVSQWDDKTAVVQSSN